MVAVPGTKPRRSVAFAADSPPRNCLSEQERLDLMIRRQNALLAQSMQMKLEIVVPFAERCQKRLDDLGGWRSHGISFESGHAREVQ
eukprot:425276-Amphidinium_carterae.1